MPTHPENASFNELAALWQQSGQLLASSVI